MSNVSDMNILLFNLLLQSFVLFWFYFTANILSFVHRKIVLQRNFSFFLKKNGKNLFY